MAKVLNVEVVVVGGGPAGLTAAIALAGAGIETALIARKPPADHRTSALLAGSVAALETLGVWDACAGQAAPLRTLRIVDGRDEAHKMTIARKELKRAELLKGGEGRVFYAVGGKDSNGFAL